MPFQDDCEDTSADDGDFVRPAVTINIFHLGTGKRVQTIKLPELRIPASELCEHGCEEDES